MHDAIHFEIAKISQQPSSYKNRMFDKKTFIQFNEPLS